MAQRICFLGRGGSGKSTVAQNLGHALALKGYHVLLVGNDISLSSTVLLRGEADISPALEDYREHYEIDLNGVTLIDEMLDTQGVSNSLQLDFILYDISGETPCTGYILPIREGVMQRCIIVTNGSFASVTTANSILQAILRAAGADNFPVQLIVNNASCEETKEELASYARRATIEILITAKSWNTAPLPAKRCSTPRPTAPAPHTCAPLRTIFCSPPSPRASRLSPAGNWSPGCAVGSGASSPAALLWRTRRRAMVDVVFTGGRVVDVRTCTSRIANVAVEHGKIVDISAHELPAKRVVDAAGLVVAPGFIDVHGHLDGHAYAGQLSAMQGITTTVGGNCGLSPLDLEGWFAGQARTGYVINQAELVGHSFSMRRAVGIEDVNARASAAQTDAMVRIADRALRAGAAGVSLGLDYAPGSGLAEIDAMAAIAAEYGRCLPVHTRLFTQNDLYSLYEMLAAAKRSGGRLLLSHFVYQYSGFGTLRPALDVVDAARAKGMDVWMDSGMYTDWATYAGTATFDEQTIKDNSLRFGDMVAATGKYTGTRLNRELYELLRHKYPDESIICYSGEPYEIYEALQKPYAMMSTDAGAYAPGEGHPQIAGSYPRFLRKMVREKRLLGLEEAVYKCTLLPAQTYHIPGKGVLEPGYDADLVLFDRDAVRDNAKMPDKGEPDAPPDGIPYVMVNGVFAVDDGVFQNTRSGCVIRY